MPNYFWEEEVFISQATIDRALEALRNQWGSRVVPSKRLTISEKIKLMWERSYYYKKQEAKKKQSELALYYKKHKPKPYYRAKERW